LVWTGKEGQGKAAIFADRGMGQNLNQLPYLGGPQTPQIQTKKVEK